MTDVPDTGRFELHGTTDRWSDDRAQPLATAYLRFPNVTEMQAFASFVQSCVDQIKSGADNWDHAHFGDWDNDLDIAIYLAKGDSTDA